MNTERTPAKDAPSFDIMRPGGKNSPYNKDGTPKKKKKPTGPTGGESQRNKPKPHKSTYNPYGKGATANPSNMSATTGS